MSAPLFDAVTAHAKKQKVSMHMPAHKGKFPALGGIQNFDITEIPDTGSLFDGEGATALAEAQAQKLFGSAATFMSAGGCTLCIQAMFRAPHRTAEKSSAGALSTAARSTQCPCSASNPCGSCRIRARASCSPGA